ncbi:MAG: transporter [Acidobacteriota bacterium]
MLSALAAPLRAQEAIAADRPGFADGSSIVGKGIFQVEVGANLDQGDDTVLSLPTLFRWGLSDALELRIESDVLSLTGGDAEIAPLAAGFKWRFRDGEVPLSLLASVGLPSGEGSSRSEGFETEVRVVSDIDLGNGFSFTPNAGVAVAEGGPFTAVVAATVGKEVGAFGPFLDVELRAGDGDPAMIVDGGVAWIVRNDTQLDVAGGASVLGDDSSDWFLTAGISHRF